MLAERAWSPFLPARYFDQVFESLSVSPEIIGSHPIRTVRHETRYPEVANLLSSEHLENLKPQIGNISE